MSWKLCSFCAFASDLRIGQSLDLYVRASNDTVHQVVLNFYRLFLAFGGFGHFSFSFGFLL